LLKRLLALLGLVALVGAGVGYAQLDFASLAGSESLYHLAASERLLEDGFARQFPWLTLSLLNAHFSDPHLLLHLLLAPLLWAGMAPPLAGKLVIALGAASLSAAIYAWLVCQRARLPWGFTALCLSASPCFVAELNSLTSSALVQLELVGLLACLAAGKRRGLWAIGIASAYTFALFPAFWLVAGLFTLFSGLEQKTDQPKVYLVGTLLSPVVLGSLVGSVCHPYFPNNLILMSYQLVALVDLPALFTAVPGTTAAFLGDTGLPLIAGVISLMMALRARLGLEPLLLTLFALASASLIMAMLWPAVTSYAVLLGLLFSALTISRVADHDALSRSERFNRVTLGILLFICAPLCALSIKWGLAEAGQQAEASRPERYQGAVRWLQENTRPGALVAADPADFPAFFYLNRHNHYISGLGPVYADVRSERLALAHRLMYEGRLGDPAVYLQTVGARYLCLTERAKGERLRVLRERVAQSGQFSSAYADPYTQIFILNSVSEPSD
jgi:hypothetical protein